MRGEVRTNMQELENRSTDAALELASFEIQHVLLFPSCQTQGNYQ